MKNLIISLLLIYLGIMSLDSQEVSWTIELEPVFIESLPGVQSYAYGQLDGQWIIIGGRRDGLHERPPFASFHSSGNNKQIIIVDPIKKRFRTLEIEGLPQAIKEQVQSSNMEFHQQGKYLYLFGGYGYSQTVNDHTTYPFITRVDLAILLEAKDKSEILSDAFVQKEFNEAAVTGGRIEMMDDKMYLVGGQFFHGRYNPHGPDHGPGFIQNYTSEIRVFTINNTDTDFEVKLNIPVHDEINLHRRDYNLVPQVRDGKEMLVAFSGVFQKNVDLPYLYPIEINSEGIDPITSFSQYLNHYHCAFLSMYDKNKETMHNIFFGGIAQFYIEDDTMIQDNNVPFVKTITNVSYTAEEGWREMPLDINMPDYFGASSEFILNEDIPRFKNGVVKLEDMIEEDAYALGYIYGGIRSSQKNIFWINDGTQSMATPRIFMVTLKQHGISNVTEDFINTPLLVAIPNPNQGRFRLVYDSPSVESVKIILSDVNGKMIQRLEAEAINKGKNYFNIEIPGLVNGIYIIQLMQGNQKLVRKVIVDL